MNTTTEASRRVTMAQPALLNTYAVIDPSFRSLRHGHALEPDQPVRDELQALDAVAPARQEVGVHQDDLAVPCAGQLPGRLVGGGPLGRIVDAARGLDGGVDLGVGGLAEVLPAVGVLEGG